jgi:hypothetical protein
VLDLYSEFLYHKEIAKNKRNEYGRSKGPWKVGYILRQTELVSLKNTK